MERTKSCSSLNELIYGQSHLYNQSYSHIFRLTGENFVVYGICVVKNELLEVTTKKKRRQHS